MALLGNGVGSSRQGLATLPPSLETDQVVARAFLSSSLLWRSMSSISRTFCKGHQGKPGIRAGTLGANIDVRLELDSANLSHSWLFISTWISPSTSQWTCPLPLACCFSYLGDFSKDDPLVLSALSQGLHVSQEFLPLLDFLDHWTGRRVVIVQGKRGHEAPGGVGAGAASGRGSGSVVRHVLALRPLGSALPGSWPPHSPPQHNWPW